jgi:hypothetical protein
MRMTKPSTMPRPRHPAAWLCGAAILAIPVAFAAMRQDLDPPPPGDFVVHEWGTFLATNGSDGVSLEGMYHEEHALPSFVHARSKDQLRLPSALLKGETPVIYFYTQAPLDVRVDVRFPQGIWTQWFPQVARSGPTFAQMPSPTDLRNGRLTWFAQVIPAGNEQITLPETSSDALWNHAREVDAAYVRTIDYSVKDPREETERFLFYRGLGRASLPLSFSTENGGTLALPATEPHGINHVFVLRVENGRGAFAYHPALRPGAQFAATIPSMSGASPLDEFTTRLADDLAAALVASGLYEKEARAMVNTWRASYFQTEGIRALFIMPQSWTDAFIPLRIAPAPSQTVRVMVGRIEHLTPEREARAEQAIQDLASPDASARSRAFAFLRDQGRYVEPIIRRVLATTRNAAVQTLARQLLAADLVTELQSAVRSAPVAAEGLLREDPIDARAQLATLLHQIGRADEANAEARAVLELLKNRPAPSMNNPDFRGYGRAFARALEASGDAHGARESYDRFIRFGSQAITQTSCRACHRESGPQTAAWFRTWWAGPRFAEFAGRTEGLESTIKRLRESPPDTSTRLRLAYLLEAQGDMEGAERLWKTLDSDFMAVSSNP